MSKTKTKAAAMPVPQTYVEVADAIYRIGEYDRQIAKLDIGFKEAQALVKKTHEEQSQPLAKLRELLISGVVTYCEAHRVELTENGKTKTASFTSGKVSWRSRPRKCSLPKDQGPLIAFLERKRSLWKFLRVTKEVSKEALLAAHEEAKTLPGVKIGSEGEDIIVEPFSTESLEAAS
jgi:phage host-nuclease inhibitor protein Gam